VGEREGSEIQIQIGRSEDVVEPAPIYSNFMQATSTPEDLTVHFGWYTIPPVISPPPDNVIQASVTPVARIVLPLNLVRNVIAALQRAAEAHEANFGPLPEHPNKPDWLKEKEAKES
jgi:hypothetical protein